MQTIIRISVLPIVLLSLYVLTLAVERQFQPRTDPSGMTGDEYYTEQWKKVDEALGKGLPKSALEIVEKIYARAKTESNKPQLIKAIAHRVALLAETNEDGETRLIQDIEKEISGAVQPTKSILQSMLADVYWSYYQTHRWTISQRTQVSNKPDEDFRTWDAAKFFAKARDLYVASLEEEPVLRKTPIKTYEVVIIHHPESEKYRPTLFDVLAHRAIGFFSNDETDLPKAQKEFELITLDALKPATDFARMNFETPDETEGKYLALTMYQRLLRFHLVEKNVDAIVDLDLERLKFARETIFHEEKDTMYVQALQTLEKEYREHSISSQVLFEIANFYYQRGEYVRAMEICEQGQHRFSGSRGSKNCRSLISNILQKEISLSVEETALPDVSGIISVSYRNLTKVYCRIIPDERNTEDVYDYDYRRSIEDWLKEQLKKKPLHAWSQALPATNDYKSHRTEIKAPALPLGRYLLFLSAAEDFSLAKNAIEYTSVNATRLSLQSQQRDDGSIVCYVNDAESGVPLEGVTVRLYAQKWNSGANKYERELLKKTETGRNGSFALAPGEFRDQVYVVLKNKNDEYRVGNAFSPYHRGKEQRHNQTIFFTDRSLYRPGQTIYFKGIMISMDPEAVKYEAAAKKTTTVGFYDVNHQKISEQTFTTNEYGSFNGTFTAPSGVLTGQMTIRNESGSHYIRVEEYKRPKFEVTFQPIKGSFRLNETIHTKGTAKAYAGSNIDGAHVKYRVVRRARFPYWYWWWRPAPGGIEKEIAHGTTKTNENGEFGIDFEALPDKSIAKKDLPIFDYTVFADVTDINGETRSGSTGLSVGYISLVLSASIGDQLDAREKHALALHSANLSGQPLKATGSILIEKLQTPKKIYRERLFAAPDKFALSEEEFTKLFPHDVYRDELIDDVWNVERVAMSKTFSTNETGNDSIAITDLAQGRYRITVRTKDPSGEDIVVKKFVTVYDRNEKRLPFNAQSIFVPLKTSGEPGETVSFIWGTSYANAKVLYQIVHRGVVVKEEWLTLDAEKRRFDIPLKEEHRGGLQVNISMVRAYRLSTESITLYVPWTNKQLHVETATFRDKLKPGQQEEWRITIKGSKSEAVAAELVAAMYDASLDAIWRNYWRTFSWPSFYTYAHVSENTFGVKSSQQFERDWNDYVPGHSQSYDELNLFLLNRGRYYYFGAGMRKMRSADGFGEMQAAPMAIVAESAADGKDDKPRAAKKEMKNGGRARGDEGEEVAQSSGEDLGQVKARSNFNETAFFFPQLQTNEKGEVVLKFTIPEALTRWRMLTFAHTPDMKIGALEKTTVTQKELMVVPNAPRFLREGDEIVLPAKITNMSEKAISGSARLQMFDAVTMQPIDAEFKLQNADQKFSAEKERSTSVSWKLSIPPRVGAVVYRIVASAGEFSDGEEAPLPVLPNRMLVTETLPLNIRGNQSRTYTFEKLVNAGSSSTLRHHRLSLEMTSNPAWYAVQALPYLMEYPYECSEQVFNRFYANSIASHLVNSSPKIKRIFEQWKGTDALLSNLEKNQELKDLLLQETPWVLQAQNESERKKRIALLFDLNAMSQQLDNAIRKLEKAQGGNGGFPWFPGMPESRYITQYIVAGLGHLKELGITSDNGRINRMVERANRYLDEQMQTDYEELKRQPTFNPKHDYLNYLEVQYLYARSYFLSQKIDGDNEEGLNFWLSQAKRFWVPRNYMMQGMIALALKRFDDTNTPKDIVASLRERSLQSDEMGMYWKYERGWYWYQAPIETQALLIEVFDVVANDLDAVEEMKIWLLKQKQVQDWKTTVATAEACYALLRRGSDLLVSDKLVEVTMGGEKVDPTRNGGTVEAGTGYFKTSWSGGEIKPTMGKISATKSDKGIAWGAVYWQYYEQLDKITPAKTPLQIEKKLYKQVTTEKGVVLEPITANNELRVGDVLKARIEIRVDRDMEYVHLKDMRGAGFELINQLSRYRWQGSLGYYEAPKDASVNFFIYWLPKGVHVFEYPLRVSHTGTFSNGISSIQCMYAPEFASHTQGFVVKVK